MPTTGRPGPPEDTTPPLVTAPDRSAPVAPPGRCHRSRRRPGPTSPGPTRTPAAPVPRPRRPRGARRGGRAPRGGPGRRRRCARHRPPDDRAASDRSRLAPAARRAGDSRPAAGPAARAPAVRPGGRPAYPAARCAAPPPPAGAPRSRPPGSRGRGGDDEDAGDGEDGSTGPDDGWGVLPAQRRPHWPLGTDDADGVRDDWEERTRRPWLRLPLVVVVLAVVAVLVAAGVTLVNRPDAGREHRARRPERRAERARRPPGQRLRIVSVQDLDPFAGDRPRRTRTSRGQRRRRRPGHRLADRDLPRTGRPRRSQAGRGPGARPRLDRSGSARVDLTLVGSPTALDPVRRARPRSGAPTGIEGLEAGRAADGRRRRDRDRPRPARAHPLRRGLADLVAAGRRRLPRRDRRDRRTVLSVASRPRARRIRPTRTTARCSPPTSPATRTPSGRSSPATATGSGRWPCARPATRRRPPTPSRTRWSRRSAGPGPTARTPRVTTWLHRIVVNACLDRMRRPRVRAGRRAARRPRRARRAAHRRRSESRASPDPGASGASDAAVLRGPGHAAGRAAGRARAGRPPGPRRRGGSRDPRAARLGTVK